MDLEAHVDPHLSVRSNHFSDNKWLRSSQPSYFPKNSVLPRPHISTCATPSCQALWESVRFLERVWRKNSKKSPKCSSHWGLSIELFNVKFRALGGPKLLFLRFLHFKNRFWRRVWRKNSKYSSHWDLSIELFNVEFRALEVLASRFLWHFSRLGRVFQTLNVVSGEGYVVDRKVLELNFDF